MMFVLGLLSVFAEKWLSFLIKMGNYVDIKSALGSFVWNIYVFAAIRFSQMRGEYSNEEDK
jgi:hypothetical protein